MKKAMHLLILFLIVASCIPLCTHAEEAKAVRIAVLPFDVFSLEAQPDLSSSIAVQVSRQLSLNPYILMCDFEAVRSVLKERGYTGHGEVQLKEIAKLVEANFVLVGSLTRIGDEMSMDVQLFNHFTSTTFFKTFVEGDDLDKLVEQLSNKIEDGVLDEAALLPPEQRPTISIAAQADTGSERSPGERDQRAPASTTEELPLQREIERELGLAPRVVEKPKEKQYAEKAEHEQPEPEPDQQEELGRETVQPAQEKAPQEKKTAAAPVTREKKKKKKKPAKDQFAFDQPVNIHSDSMEYDNKKNEAVFKGNVVARSESIVMFADTMRVLNNQKGGLKQISATGNVKVIQEDKIATGKRIVYYNAQEKIVATGSPRVWQGDNVLQGNKITVFLKEDRIVVEGGTKDRVSATLYPKQKKKK